MLEIKSLHPADYAGKQFTFRYETKGYYAVLRTENGFDIRYQSFPEARQKALTDSFFADWLENPVAFGVFEDGELIGFVEGAPEAWNNRFRISNIGLFDCAKRGAGLGTMLMNVILEEARKSGARMVILETQTCNERAIAFYRKHGFDIIGFDLYAYSNEDPERQEVRIEMGRRLP